MAPQGHILVNRQDGQLAFRVEGWATMKQSLAVRRMAETALSGLTTCIQVDLRQCAYMDSTFLGTLLFLHRACKKRPACEFHLFAPSPECLKLIQQLGLDEVFRVRTAPEPAPGAWTELTREVEDVTEVQGNVLQAHKELAGLDSPAAQPFRAVVDCLEKDLKNK